MSDGVMALYRELLNPAGPHSCHGAPGDLWDAPSQQTQRWLFDVDRTVALAEARISEDEIKRWIANGWLSPEVASQARLNQPTLSDDDLPVLLKATLDHISINVSAVPDPPRAERAIRRLLGNLAGVGGGVTEVRNSCGTGHGKDASAGQLDSLYARLVVGAATALGAFLFQAYHDGRSTSR